MTSVNPNKNTNTHPEKFGYTQRNPKRTIWLLSTTDLMDNPQHYQPLSHALNPPIVQPQYEEEEEGDDEGAVEEQLEREDDDGDQ